MPAGPDGCSVCSGSRGYGGITALTEAFNVNKCISANKQLFNLHAYSFWFKTGMVGVLFVGHLTPYFHVCLQKEVLVGVMCGMKSTIDTVNL